jgi:hypothetical protein
MAGFTQTRISIAEQLRAACAARGAEFGSTTYGGRIHYLIDGAEADLREACAEYLPGGFDESYGRAHAAPAGPAWTSMAPGLFDAAVPTTASTRRRRRC